MSSNPWKKSEEPLKEVCLTDIMCEEVAKGLQLKEDLKAFELSDQMSESRHMDAIPAELLKQFEGEYGAVNCDSDSTIAQLLQIQYDKEYDERVKKVERKHNGTSKVSISYDNYRFIPEELIYDSSDEELPENDKKDWDLFETNEKEFGTFPKCGYKFKEGEMISKHDSTMSGRRNACRVMAFPPEFRTGDGAGFDMKLPNSVFNSLKAHSRSEQARLHKMLDRKESQATAVLGIDEKTKLLLYKFVNNGMMEKINGVISTGKESVVLHANSDAAYTELILPSECAIKVFKTTLSEFKTRDKYIEADYRFKDRFSKQNPRKIVHMWAEKEMHNMMRIQSVGINCPSMIALKKHILIMSFIGSNGCAAPKLKDVILKPDQWAKVYDEVTYIMRKLYSFAHLIHADLSEYNILYHDKKCWLIDVSQSVEPDHPNGLEFLLRDCKNISNFFERKGVENVSSAQELFQSITGLKDIDINLLEGVRSNANSASERFEIEPDDARNVKYSFEYVWNKTQETIKARENPELDPLEKCVTESNLTSRKETLQEPVKS